MQLTYNNQSLLGSGCYEAEDTRHHAHGPRGDRGDEPRRHGDRHVAFGRALDARGHRSLRPADRDHACQPRVLAQGPAQQVGCRAEGAGRARRACSASRSIPTTSRAARNARSRASRPWWRGSPTCIGVDHIGIGSDLCQDQPDSVVAWMRNGRWTKGDGEHRARRRGVSAAAGLVPRQSRLRQDPRRALCAQGFSASDAAKIMGGNWYRFFADAFTPRARPTEAGGARSLPTGSEESDMSTRSETAGFMAMKGAGYYSKATIGARDVINAAAPLILAAIDRIPRNDCGRPFRCADLGCADGGTSVEMWRRALAHQRAREPARPIEIVYADLPRNDFSQLFRMIHGQTDIHELLRRDPGRLSVRLGHLVPPGDLPAREPRPRLLGHGLALHLEGAGQHRQSRAHGGRRAPRSGAPTRRRAASSGSGCCSCAPASSCTGGRLVFLNFGIDARAAISATPAA